MGPVLGQGKSSMQQQTSSAFKEQIPSLWTENGSLFQDKFSSGRPFGKPYLDKKCEIKQYSGPKKVVNYKSSQNGQKSHSGDELVKHMSNLPGFLQRVEKDNNSSIQEKALNFGVLDWKRLEKWKYNERMPAKKSPSSTNSFRSANGPPKMDPNLRKQPSSLSSRFTSPQRRPIQFQSKTLSSSKEENNVESVNSEGKTTCIDNQQDSFHQKLQFYERSCSKTNVYESKKGPKNSLSPEQAASHDNIFLGEKSGEKFDEQVISISECHPENFPRTSCSESLCFSESRTSLDGQLTDSIGNRLSDCVFSQELFVGELSAADIPRSCPLPSGAAYQADPTTEPPIYLNNCTDSCPFPSNRNRADVAELATTKGRTPSPTRRFSFSLGKMGRSLSFKESSAAAPQLSSSLYTAVKSGPVMRPEVSDNSERDKANPVRKSSPLRRLIDPLLKHKGSQSPNCPPNGTVRNSKGSTFQALLQLSSKNGLPLFKLVVDNSSDMLAAVAKRVPASGKSGESCLIYAFYSVHEVRKKGMNWLSQGSKSKSCSLGYNMIGRMDVLSSCNARECIVYGVDPADKQIPEFATNKEIAAFVVKKSEIENSKGMTVILPGGVHGVPIKGSPSSLVSRWRSGGSCDCGGWDIGCKLQILSDDRRNGDSFGAPIPSSRTDRLNLFVQGGDQKMKPVLSLETFNSELYSIELDMSISLLEAFAMCVSYVTCRSFSEILDSKDESDAKFLPESVTGTDRMNTVNTCQGQVPAKYVAYPPLSPAGRI